MPSVITDDEFVRTIAGTFGVPPIAGGGLRRRLDDYVPSITDGVRIVTLVCVQRRAVTLRRRLSDLNIGQLRKGKLRHPPAHGIKLIAVIGDPATKPRR